MTPRHRSASERVAIAMYRSGFLTKEFRDRAAETFARLPLNLRSNLLIAARYHLSALRAARGERRGIERAAEVVDARARYWIHENVEVATSDYAKSRTYLCAREAEAIAVKVRSLPPSREAAACGTCKTCDGTGEFSGGPDGQFASCPACAPKDGGSR